MGSAFIPNMTSVNFVGARVRRQRFVNTPLSTVVLAGGAVAPANLLPPPSSMGIIKASTRELDAKDSIWTTTVAP